MPQLLAPLIVTASAGAIGTAAATTIATAALYVGTTAASMLIQQAQQPKQETGTKLHPASGGDVSQSIIVGEKETAGSFIYGGSWGQPGRTPNAFYVSVYDLQDMPSTAILARCWHADNKGTLDLSRLGYTGSDAEEEGEIMGYPVDSLRDDDGNDYAWVKFLDGSQTTADSYLRTMFGGLTDKPWKSTMIGRGRTLMIVTEKFNVDDPTAEKNFTVVLQGMKLYDWRKDSTNGGSGSHRWGDASTYEYSGNNIVIGYNIMRGIFRGSTWLYGGQNWPARRFDNDTWTAAANTCDENIALAGGGTEKRFRMGAEISLAEDPASVLERVFAACGARLVESGGIYKIHVGGIGGSVYSFTDDDIFVTEDRSGTLFPSREDICNTITGSYCEPSNGGQMKAYGKRFKQAYIDADGGEVRPKEMTFEYVRENRQAQRLAAHALNDNRRFTTRSIVLPPIARKLEPEDTLSWTGDRYGYSNKKWICGDITLSDSGLVIAAIREADATDADWSPSDEKPYTVGVYGDIVPATQTIDITAVAAGIKNAAGTNKAPGIKISWTIDKDMVDCKAVRWQVRLLDIDDVMDAGRVEFDEGKALIKDGILRNEVYQVRARIIPYSDRKTGWCAWKTVTADNYGAIGDDDFDNTPPPNIPNNPIWLPTVSNKPQVTSDADKDEDGKVVITVTTDWVELANDKIDYQLRLAYGSKVRWLNARSSPREFVGRSGVAYTIRVRPIGRTGVKGNLSDAITFTATKKSTVPDTPTSLTATAKFGRIVLRWNKPAATETDFRRANVYVSDDNNFAHATLLDNFTASKGEHGDLGNNVTKFYWITFENLSGVESLKFPVSDTGGRTATTLRVADDDVDATALAAPTGVSLDQDNIDLDDDGKVDIALLATCDNMGSSYKNYEFELWISQTSGGTFTLLDTKKSKSGKVRFPAKSNKYYKLRAYGFNVGGNPGNYSTTFAAGGSTRTFSTYAGFKPAKKTVFTPVGGVGTPTVTAKPKGFYTSWPACTDKDYAYTILIRFDTSTGTQNAWQGKGDHHTDNEDLVVGRSYVYSIRHVDTSGNDSAIGTPAAGVVYRIVEDGDTDQTPPGTPTATTLNQYTADVDGDSTIDTGLSMTLLSPAGVPVKWLEVQIWRSATLGGTYAALPKRYMVKADSSGTTDFAFEGSSSKFYKARYRGVSFNGKEGPFSLLSAAQQPLQYLSSIPTPTVSVTPKPKSMNLKWPKWQNNTFSEAIIYCDGVEIDRTKASYYTDQTERTVDTNYTYTVQFQDKQDRVGALSAGVTAKYRAAVTADITPKAVTASLTDFGDTSNMVIGSDLAEPALWIGTGGVPTQALPNIVSASKFRLVSATSSTATTRIQSAPDYRIPVEADTQYTMSASIGSNIGVSANYSLRINWYSRDASGNAAPISQSIAASFVGTAITYLVGTVVSPSNASWAEFLVLKSASAVASPIELNEPWFSRTIDGDLLADGTINKSKTTAATPSTPAPGTLTVSQDPRAVQGDGTVQMTAKLTASSLPAGAETITFDVDYSYPAGTDVKSFDAGKGLSVTIPITYNQTIGVTYKGVGFNENAGPPIASAVTLTPVADITTIEVDDLFVAGIEDYVVVGISYPGGTNIPPVNAGYLVVYYSTSPTMALPSAFRLGPEASAFVKMPFAGTWYFQVRIVTTSGKYSAYYPPSTSPKSAVIPGLSVNSVNATFFNDGLAVMAFGAVGSTAFLKKTSAGTTNSGGTENGSDLVYSDTSLTTGTIPTGVWQAQGRCPSGQATVWKRIS